jgi:hypothetical protein
MNSGRKEEDVYAVVDDLEDADANGAAGRCGWRSRQMWMAQVLERARQLT